MRITRTRVVWTGILVAAGLGITAAMWPDPELVEAAIARRGPLAVTVNAEARTRTRYRFIVTAPVTGRLQRLWLHPGDGVKAGVPIAVIAPLPMDAASVEAARGRVIAADAGLLDAETRVRQARESAALAARTAERYREIERVGGISRQHLEEATVAATLRADDLAASEARVRAAAAELSAARAAFPTQRRGHGGAVVVHAPSAGRVLAVPQESERIVTAGTPILEIGRPEDLEVVADVLSEDAVRIAPGATVELGGWGGADMLRGVVTSVEPGARTVVSALGVDEQRVSVVISPTDASRALGDGYRLDARIVIWNADSVLTVPASAVFSVGAGSGVFVIEEGRARQRLVRVGQRSEHAVEIIEGVAPGESIVLFPSDRISSGARVRVRSE